MIPEDATARCTPPSPEVAYANTYLSFFAIIFLYLFLCHAHFLVNLQVLLLINNNKSLIWTYEGEEERTKDDKPL